METKKRQVGAIKWRAQLKTISKKLSKSAIDLCDGDTFGAKIALFNATTLLKQKDALAKEKDVLTKEAK